MEYKSAAGTTFLQLAAEQSASNEARVTRVNTIKKAVSGSS